MTDVARLTLKRPLLDLTTLIEFGYDVLAKLKRTVDKVNVVEAAGTKQLHQGRIEFTLLDGIKEASENVGEH